MSIMKLSAAVMMVGLIAASPVLAQNSMNQAPAQPALQNPGGVAGGFASSGSKNAATKQKAQSLTPPTNEDTTQKSKP